MATRRRTDGRAGRRSGRVAAALAAAAVVTAGIVVPAIAAPADPWVGVAISKVSDGTGHGSSAQTFVNAANGFVPGDDAPDDGVVASGDTVTYQVRLTFEASSARVVTVTLDLPPYLEWPVAGDQLCRNGTYVRATRTGNTCSFVVPAGAVESIAATLTLRALDTGGSVQEQQVVDVLVAKSGSGTFAAASAPPVTVVSAPAADVVVTHPGHTSLRDGQIVGSSLSTWTDQPTGGHFLATPLLLTYPGWSSHGASIANPWWGFFDVSAFPPEATWAVGGVAQVPVDGLLVIPPTSGQVRIDYALPTGWPDQEPFTIVDYPVRVVVDPGSFAVDQYLLNNGTGWQPGDGQDALVSTLDPQIGAIAGRPLPNNDWSTARITRPGDYNPSGIGSKGISGPWDPTRTVWEDVNIRYADGADEGNRADSLLTTGAHHGVAPGTELSGRLNVYTPAITARDGEQIVLGDTWGNDATWPEPRSFYDPRGALVVVGPDDQVLPDTLYEVWWSPQPKTAAQTTDLTDPGWVLGIPDDTARALRIVFAPDALPTGDEPGAGWFTAAVPWIIAPRPWVVDDVAFDPADDLHTIANTVQITVVAGGAVVDTAAQTRTVTLRLPPTPHIAIDQTITDVGGYAPLGDPPITPVGDTVTFRLDLTVFGLASASAQVTPTVTIELDRCLTAPRLLTGGWVMTVTEPATPGPTGRVCGDPESSPAVLTFTPQGGTTPIATWTNLANGNGELTDLYWTAQVAAISEADAPMTAAATFAIAEAATPASDASAVTTAYVERATAWLRSEQAQVQVGDPITWTAGINTYAPSDFGGPATDTVIVLPRPGDGVLFCAPKLSGALPYDCGEGYVAAPESVFDAGYTGYTVAAGFDPENTSPGAELWYTTAPDAGPYPPTDLDPGAWVLLLPGDPLPAGVTALRITLPGGTGPSAASLRFTITPDASHSGEIYQAWMGETTAGLIDVAVPYPAPVRVVAGTIAGLLWWDDDADARADLAEPGIEGVSVRLHAEAGGVPGAVVGVTTTDAAGRYEFTELHSGRYLVVVERGTAIPATVTTYYDQTMPVDATYSYRGQRFADATETSSVVDLPAAGRVDHVDFGFHEPDPYLTIDKSPASTDCWNGICSVTWDVRLTNAGRTPISGLTLTDTTTGTPLDLSAMGLTDQTVVDIAGGYSYSLALTDRGEVYAWGLNSSGQLGDGTTTDRHTPVPVQMPEGVTFTAVTAGVRHALAIDQDGRAWAWGEGASGKLGNGTLTASTVPVPVQMPTDVVFTSVAGGEVHSLAVSTAGDVWAWGGSQYGKLGNSVTLTNSFVTPQLAVRPAGVTFTAVSAGTRHSVVLDSEGNAWAMGANTYGELGTAGSGSASVPTPVVMPDGVKFAHVDAGGYQFSAALDTEGTYWAWGSVGNSSGNGSASSSPLPAPATMPDGVAFTTFEAAQGHVTALAEDGSLWGWGAGSRVGDGTGTARSVPTRVSAPSGAAFTAVAANGNGHSLALSGDALVYGWGVNDYGQVGDGTTATATAPALVVAPDAPLRATDISAGGEHSLALASDGTVYAWGRNNNGQIGDGTTVTTRTIPTAISVPDDLPTGVSFRAVSAGTSHSVALDSDGRAWAWGLGTNGRLGDGGTANQNVPVLVSMDNLPDLRFTQVSAGDSHTLALADDGGVYAWGAGGNGRLGVGDTSQRVIPTRASTPSATMFTAVSAGTAHSLALDTNGQVWAWGSGGNGRLGDGGTAQRTTPTQVSMPGVTFTAVAAGSNYSLALDSHGMVWVWGANSAGQLGMGDPTTSTNSLVPIPVTTPDGVTAFTAIDTGSAGTHPVAIASDGTAWAWGNNASGQLGDGTTGNALVPIPMLQPSSAAETVTFAAVAPGTGHTLALSSTGAIYATGAAGYGRLGNGTTSPNQSTLASISVPTIPFTPPARIGARVTPFALAPQVCPVSGGGTVPCAARSFTVPVLAAGQSAVYRVAATYLQPHDPDPLDLDVVDPLVVANQAWATSPTTPYARTPNALAPAGHGLTAPLPPTLPALAAVDALGITGNVTCNTDAESQVPEDSCDQTPAVVPITQTAPGRITGVVWVDGDGDGVRADGVEALVEGAVVTLWSGETMITQTTTDAAGAYAFLVPPGEYVVAFTVNHLPAPGGGSWAYTVQDAGGDDTADSDVDAVGRTGVIVLDAGGLAEHHDAGLVEVGTGIVLTKTLDGPEQLPVPAGGTAERTVTVTMTNTGDEALTEIEWADVTVSGPEVTGWECDPAVTTALVLPPGAAITCTGTLTLPAGGAHLDEATVVARGTATQRLVEAGDDLTVTTLPLPAIELPATGHTAGPPLHRVAGLLVLAVAAVYGATRLRPARS